MAHDRVTVADTDIRSSCGSTSTAPGAVERLSGAPLWLQGMLLAVVLLAILPFTSSDEIWSSDEGAIRLQAEILAEDGVWTLERPFAEIDPEQMSLPIAAATSTHDAYAPYARHPAVPLLFAGVVALVGQAWAVVLSILAATLAAVFTALIAVPFGRKASVLSLWAVGLASPLLAYSFMVLGHTIGAAIAALLILCVMRFLRDRRVYAIGILVCGFTGPLIRTEAALLGFAVAGIIFVMSMERRHRAGVGVGFGLALATAVGYWVNAAWEQAVAGSDRIDWMTAGAMSTNWTQMLSGLATSVFSAGGRPLGSIALMLLFASVGALGLAVRSSSGTGAFVVPAGGLVIVAGVCVGLVDTGYVPGLLFAFPLGVFGIVCLRSSEIGEQPGIFLGAIVLTFAALVIVTQEPSGGGAQWGGRYFILSIPALVPLTTAAAVRSVGTLDRPARVIAVVALLAATFATGLSAAQTLHSGGVASSDLARQIEEASLHAGDAGDGQGPLVLSTMTQIGRHGWQQARSIRYSLVASDDLGVYAGRLAERGIDRVLLISSSEAEIQVVLDSGFGIESEPFAPRGSARFLILGVEH